MQILLSPARFALHHFHSSNVDDCAFHSLGENCNLVILHELGGWGKARGWAMMW